MKSLSNTMKQKQRNRASIQLLLLQADRITPTQLIQCKMCFVQCSQKFDIDLQKFQGCRYKLRSQCHWKNQPGKILQESTISSQCIIYNLMNNQINIIVQNQAFLLERDLLISESENAQIKNNKDYTLPLPQWITKQVYLLIQKFLKVKDVKFLKSYINENDVIVKLLRAADYLGMVRFHDRFINDILIPNINHKNCLTLLEESHKKLKNINDSQTWYNLLNMSIIYLATNAYEIFNLHPFKFKKLNEKIITQVLERVIRLERKNNFPNRHMLYQLIMESKQPQIVKPSMLFEYLRKNLKDKKIHSRIHAKLSWKLENLSEIVQKKTKNFKYLQMTWYLKAHVVGEGLLVTLNLLPFDEASIRQSEVSDTMTQKSDKRPRISEEGSQIGWEDSDNQNRIGVFYSKVNWKLKDQVFQQQLKIHYIMIDETSSMQIILLDKNMQNMIGAEKIELTIFCNTDIIYTFLMNYVQLHFEKLTFSGTNYCLQQLLILCEASKKNANYSQALKIISELLHAFPSQKGNIKLSRGFDLGKMSKIQLEIYSSFFGKRLPVDSEKNLHQKLGGLGLLQEQKRGENNVQTQRRSVSPIPITPISFIGKKNNIFQPTQNATALTTPSSTQNKWFYKISSAENSSQNSSINPSSLSNSRGDSRVSKKKIFSGAKEDNISKYNLKDQMLRVTDFMRYLNENEFGNDEIDRIGAIFKV